MIDTVILSIPCLQTIKIDESGWLTMSGPSGMKRLIKNPSAQDDYSPRLTIYGRKSKEAEWNLYLKIEFSVPKLIFGNNLEELTNDQFNDVIKTLQNRLNKMGVVIPEDILRKAEVKAVHYSKNLKLEDGYTAQYVISELGKVNLTRRFDFTKVQYINEGQSLTAYSKSHSIIFYDKIADLENGEVPQPRPEILRMEVRLSQSRKLNSVFKQLGLIGHPSFEEVFSSEKSLIILNHYWNSIVKNYGPVLFSSPLKSLDLLTQILITHRGIKPKEAIYRTGLVLLGQESGLRALRATTERHARDSPWSRRMADFRETTGHINTFRPRDWYVQIQNGLKSYQPYRIRL